MIVTRLYGGLGNQMFQYAAGLALAEQRRTVLKLDVSWFREYADHAAHNRYALSCFNITEQFATAEEIDRVRGFPLTRTERLSLAFARAFHLPRSIARFASFRRHLGEGDLASPADLLATSDDSYLDGGWQSEAFFAPVANLLRLHFSFRYPPQPAVSELAARIRSGSSAAIHFRRGDYVRDPKFNRTLGVLGLDYYERALALLRQRAPDATLYIFSDDIEAIAQEFRPTGPHVFVRVTEPWHSFDELRLMSLCDHAILSNSTFAWWSAWLHPDATRLVIAPTPWFAGDPDKSRHIQPARWLGLPVARA